MSEKLTYTITDIATVLGVSVNTVRRKTAPIKGLLIFEKRKRFYSKTEYYAILEVFGISKDIYNI